MITATFGRNSSTMQRSSSCANLRDNTQHKNPFLMRQQSSPHLGNISSSSHSSSSNARHNEPFVMIPWPSSVPTSPLDPPNSTEISNNLFCENLVNNIATLKIVIEDQKFAISQGIYTDDAKNRRIKQSLTENYAKLEKMQDIIREVKYHEKQMIYHQNKLNELRTNYKS
jgi:hypothetical protein